MPSAGTEPVPRQATNQPTGHAAGQRLQTRLAPLSLLFKCPASKTLVRQRDMLVDTLRDSKTIARKGIRMLEKLHNKVLGRRLLFA